MKKRKRLYFKPKRAPKWWPRNGRRVRFVGVFAGGTGWVLGDGDPMTDKELAVAREYLEWDFGHSDFKTEAA